MDTKEGQWITWGLLAWILYELMQRQAAGGVLSCPTGGNSDITGWGVTDALGANVTGAQQSGNLGCYCDGGGQ